jgi:hypothetical protein
LILVANSRKGEPLMADSQIGVFFSFLCDIMGAPCVALCTLKIWLELLYFITQAHRATKPAFMMLNEQLPPYFECP